VDLKVYKDQQVTLDLRVKKALKVFKEHKALKATKDHKVFKE